MASTAAPKQSYKAWLKKTQPQFLIHVNESQEQLRCSPGWATSICIEVDNAFYYYRSSNRGKDMLLSALNAIYAKNGAVDVEYECRDVMKVYDYILGRGVKPTVDGHQIVCFKRNTINGRKRNIAHVHIMRKGNLDAPDHEDMCNFLVDLDDDSGDGDSEEDESASVMQGEKQAFQDQGSVSGKSDTHKLSHGDWVTVEDE